MLGARGHAHGVANECSEMRNEVAEAHDSLTFRRALCCLLGLDGI
jgi:hypothetical protein